MAPFFDPAAALKIRHGNLPHWQQQDVIYFVTFRLADSLPVGRLEQWHRERDAWLSSHPEPVSAADWQDYHERFTDAVERWLDQGSGSCLLRRAECKSMVESALRHFDGHRYQLGQCVVAPNHVHALVNPLPGHDLAGILHSWKSYTAKQLLCLPHVVRAMKPWWDQLHNRRQKTAFETCGAARFHTLEHQQPVWQKESFDHIVRSPHDLKKFEDYIQAHKA